MHFFFFLILSYPRTTERPDIKTKRPGSGYGILLNTLHDHW